MKKPSISKRKLPNFSQQKAGSAAYFKGFWAEILSEIFLRLKGYQCLCRRYKTPVGEVDLILKKGQTLIGVEVKARSLSSHAFDSLGTPQQKRVTRALQLFQLRNSQYHNCQLRYDFILLVGFKMCHIKDAWRL